MKEKNIKEVEVLRRNTKARNMNEAWANVRKKHYREIGFIKQQYYYRVIAVLTKKHLRPKQLTDKPRMYHVIYAKLIYA